MDTNRLKRFATEARNILMQGVAHRFTALGFLPDDLRFISVLKIILFDFNDIDFSTFLSYIEIVTFEQYQIKE